MKVLLVKMSSMGDILHTFPALTDLQAQRPDIELHWVVEKSFADMAAWHPAVSRVIPITLRHWLKQRDRKAWSEWTAWRDTLAETEYDLVIDAQGLIKSALVARQARRHTNHPNIHGYNRSAARESLASVLYQRRHAVPSGLHAVEKARHLLAAALGYEVAGPPEFGVRQRFLDASGSQPNNPPIQLIPGTTWHTKHWHPAHWQSLAEALVARGYPVEVIWGSPAEQQIANSLAKAVPGVATSAERLSIPAVTQKLAEARAVIGPDTGFSHIAGALGTNALALYGPTSPRQVGLIGDHTRNAYIEMSCAPCHKKSCKWLPADSSETPPCMRDLTPDTVIQWVDDTLQSASSASARP